MDVADFPEFQRDLLRIVQADNTGRFIFRGQRREEWKLEPSLKRGLDVSLASQDVVDRHRKSFLEALKGRRGTHPPDINHDQLWALGRHFGLQTPLLDWTRSPYVALFFAFAGANPNAYTGRRVVFALNTVRIAEKTTELQDQGATIDDLIELVDASSHENSRLLSQSGLFTRTMPHIDIQSWISEHFPKNYEHSTLIRYRFPDDLRKLVLQHLNWMNINYLTLFPDISGAAMHANLKLEFPGY